MNRIQNILLGSALLLTALAACSDHNEADTTLPDTDRQAVMLSVNIEGNAAPSDAARAATRSIQADTRAGDAADIAYAPADGAPLCLFYGNVTGNHTDSDQAAIYKYNAANTQWQADGAPLYWDNLTPASITDGQTGRLYSFYALANIGMLNGDATGGDLEEDQTDADRQAASDLMMAYAYTERRTTTTPIAFTLKHLMAQLTITLRNATDATGDARFTDRQLAGATATAKLQPNYTLAYPTIRSTTDADNAKITPATAKADDAGSPVNFALMSTVHYAKNADGSDNTAKVDHISFTCIAPPQALTGAVTINIDGRNYTFTPAAGAITLKAGVNTVQHLIAKKTGISLGKVTVTDWGTVEQGPADLTADDIYPASASLTDIKEAGILSLYAYKPGDDTPATDKPGTYPVTYNASEDKAAIDINATGYSPILWDNLTKYADAGGTLQKYAYTATYVPTGYILTGKTTDAANTELHEKDLLGSISVPTPWGIAPEFVDTKGNGISNADTRLKHLMARFIVKLTCTDGTYNAAQLNAAKLTTVRKAIADPDAPLTVSNAGVELKTTPAMGNEADNTVTLVMTVAATTNTGTADTDNIAQYSAILAPQTLTDADTEVVLRLSISGAAGTKEYSLKKAITLEAGKDNVLTAKLTQTELSIGKITVKEWDDSPKGEGDFEM